MHTRILFGVTAWVLGAGTATGGSLLAVSLLGQGITGGSGQLVSQDAVNRALASEAAEATPTVPPAVAASATPTRARAATTPSPVTTIAPPAPPPVTATPVPVTPVTTTPVPPAPTDGTVLTSPGGEVVAACPAAGAYLVSWSPQQGYEVGDVARGPAATARVTFESTTSRVTMTVSCSAGVPSATSSTRGGGDE